MAQTLLSAFMALLAIILVTIPSTAAEEVAYCSSQNTGSDNGAQTWTWQSNGWCNDQCKDSYAFGVIQGNDCWCSNYVPADQTDTGDCSESCPGFPSEFCGNADEGLYIYIKLDNDLEPSGTQGASKPTSAEPSSAPPSRSSTKETRRSSETIIKTVTEPAPVVTSTSEKPSSTLKTSTTKGHSSAPPEASTVISVITSGGGVVTQTVVFTPTSAPAMSENKKSSTNVGAIVGGVIGGLAVLVAVIGGVIFFLWRRRRQQRDEEDAHQSGVQRNTSTMSKAGLLRSGSEKVPQYPPQIHTNISRHSRIMGDNDSISPVSGSDKRGSRPYIFDQRLNPSAIMTFENTSRGSFASMDDSRDYGRTLNIRNPDPH